VLLVGAGAYPHAKSPRPGVPVLDDLTSVAPSIMTFAQRLLTTWCPTLARPLLTVDILLSDATRPGGAVWPGFGQTGEIAANTPIDSPTFETLDQALQDALKGGEPDEGLLLFFCGHGFSRADRFFVMSDFGRGGDPWSRTVNLTKLDLALQQERPRTMWLFWDCCADIPMEILDALANIGSPLIQPLASKLSNTIAHDGRLSKFGAASSSLGDRAFGIPGKPTRFTEMLIEALDGAGATKPTSGTWWVDHLGVQDAMQSYVARHPELDNPDFYTFGTPFSSDAPTRMNFRALQGAPLSFLIASSAPQPGALKKSLICILPEGEDDDLKAIKGYEPSPPKTAVVCFKLPPRKTYTVKATFPGCLPQLRSCYAELPLADSAEFQS
jgi:hypothetical protein